MPRGYTCFNHVDLIRAHELLGCEKTVVKPVFGAAGEGITFTNSVEELQAYEFTMGAVTLEEFLIVDRTPGSVRFFFL